MHQWFKAGIMFSHTLIAITIICTRYVVCIFKHHTTIVTHLFLRGALLRGYLGCLRRRSVFGRRKVGEVLIFFLLWLCTPLSTAFLAFRAFDLASVLAGTARRERHHLLFMLSKCNLTK